MNKNIVVVFKADKDIGTGHLMRIKGLLRFLQDFNLYLVSDSISSELKAQCNEYKQIIVCQKAKLVHEVLALNPILVLIDHYFLDYDFEKELYPFSKIAVIDDLVRHHMCHVLFDQWLYRKESDYQGKVPNNCFLGLGREYNYIKPEFAKIIKTKNLNSQIPRVLVNFGGSDPAHACLYTIKGILKGSLYKKYNFTVISGVSNPDHTKLQSLTKDLENIKVISHTSNVPEVFANTDFAIGACGGMFQERIMAGIPTVNVEITDNQKGVNTLVRDLKLGCSLEVNELTDDKKIEQALKELQENKALYEENCRGVFSKHGLKNIASKIIELINANS